ncbi:hypothetical protein BGW37DRAFT_470670 [Umbelopsis sp. PMI_123]|nr:hypothetical protein BGW37DRAFT_470670 [Umbelopsis sp. PMI_123]
MASNSIATLQNAFPNIPYDIIETILENNLGNVDKTFDNLLEMSDPSFHGNEERASDVTTAAARPASQRRRVTFQEPIDDYVQPTITHWQSNAQPTHGPPFEDDDQIRKDAELARKLAAEDEVTPSQSNSAQTTPNTSWQNPRITPQPIFGYPPPSQSYNNHTPHYKPHTAPSQPSSNPFNMQGTNYSQSMYTIIWNISDYSIQRSWIRYQRFIKPLWNKATVSGLLVQFGAFIISDARFQVAKQKAKELYQQLRSINMAKHSNYNNGGNMVNGRHSNNPFYSPHAPVTPPTPPRPRPVGNRTSTSIDQIRADEEYARRISDQQYHDSRAEPRVDASSNQPLEHSSGTAQTINPFQEDEDCDPPPYESHRNDRLVPQ